MASCFCRRSLSTTEVCVRSHASYSAVRSMMFSSCFRVDFMPLLSRSRPYSSSECSFAQYADHLSAPVGAQCETRNNSWTMPASRIDHRPPASPHCALTSPSRTLPDAEDGRGIVQRGVIRKLTQRDRAELETPLQQVLP